MKTKTFDCIEMKRQIQGRLYDKTKSMTAEEELAYYHTEARQFQQRLASLRKQLGRPKDTPPVS